MIRVSWQPLIVLALTVAVAAFVQGQRARFALIVAPVAGILAPGLVQSSSWRR